MNIQTQVDEKRKELWSLQGAVEVRIPMTTGLAGAAASSGAILNIKVCFSFFFKKLFTACSAMTLTRCQKNDRMLGRMLASTRITISKPDTARVRFLSFPSEIHLRTARRQKSSASCSSSTKKAHHNSLKRTNN